MTQGGMNKERNEYDKYKLIMIVVVMEDVLFEWMRDLMRKVGEICEDIGIIIMNEWLSDFDGMCYFEWIEVVWKDD